ncbi:tetratricopeptide repeat protein [Rhodohalobacter halophilus]|uniref:tetratricopeptide repeat protein n=1 Tax=Rhodohalobacter halophilus TaxID=1812810 RepID=UPI000A0692BF|nr:tetratricopeptide repeat protein [Rhodohalobacter halophilus]
MKNFLPLIFIFTFIFGLISCGENRVDLPPLPSGVQTISLLGDTLTTPKLSQEVFESHNEKFLEAISNYRIDPENAENIIWLGRRAAYLGEYREAIKIFTEGTFKNPEDPRMYRHRGHRYITLRHFDRAIRDFERAEELKRGVPDMIEPDGLPNELNQPVSTLKSNVWYHKGLTLYLKGEYHRAIETYEKSLKELDLTDDMRVAMLYWYYSALKRSGQDERAGASIEDITADMNLIENDVYLNLIMVFKGLFSPDRMMEVSDDALQNATLWYGIGNWHYMNGREERAIEIWDRILDTDEWAAFGYIAAEAEIARIVN